MPNDQLADDRVTDDQLTGDRVTDDRVIVDQVRRPSQATELVDHVVRPS
jgi:hypothetical protein